MSEVITPNKESFEKAYNDTSISSLKWTSGCCSKELIELISQEKIQKNSKILEVGCGVGTEAVFLAIRGMNVTAIDISESCIEISRKLSDVYAVNVNFEVNDVLNLPYEDKEYDVILDRGCFHCFSGKDREKYCDQISRVCKKGGILILRCFSDNDKLNNYSWVIKNTSDELISIFSNSFSLEHMERILSLPKNDNTCSEAWYTIWKKR